MRIRLTLALACCGCAGTAAPASAYVVGGYAWPDKTIRYYTAARGYASAVDRAARNWNRARVGVRFVRGTRSTADVIVSYGGERCGGASPVGYDSRFDVTRVRLGAGCSASFIVLTATHEFGHVLGLDHETSRCARMNPSFAIDGTPVRCGHHAISYWLAHPLAADDIRGAKAVYRGTASLPQHDDRDDGWHDHRHPGGGWF